MKYPKKIAFFILALFFIAQLIGLFVINAYSPEMKQVVDNEGNLVNVTTYNLPYGMDPPSDTNPQTSLISIIFAFLVAIVIMLLFMKFKAEIFLRGWFFIVVVLALGIAINSFLLGLQYSSYIALALAFPLAFFKIFKRNLIVHNATELLIYPGIAAIFVPLLNLWSIVVLLILISIYDIYAVWHAGFMQKMAQYQIEKLRLFSGFFVPYIDKKKKTEIKKSLSSRKKSNRSVKIPIALLGGGDVVFPLILAGVVLRFMGLTQAILISVGATIALGFLLYYSQKGKYYPAMPFISAGCFAALGIALLI